MEALYHHGDQKGPESHGVHVTDKEVSLKPLTAANPPESMEGKPAVSSEQQRTNVVPTMDKRHTKTLSSP